MSSLRFFISRWNSTENFTAFTTLSDKESAEALGAALEDLTTEPYGVGVFEIEDDSGLWEVGAYFTEPPDEVGLALLAAGFRSREFVVSELPEADWVAKVREGRWRELQPYSGELLKELV